MESRIATWNGRQILLVLTLPIPITIFLPYGFISIIVSLLILIKQIMLRIIFTGPMKRSPPFSDPGWDILTTSNDGSDVYGFINFHDKKSDLVVFVHGWQSSSEKYTERMNLFKSRGFHTLAIDMRGHGMAPDTLEWTAGKVINDIKALLSIVDQSKINKVHFYGHSLGGFVCIGMHHDRHQGWWKENYGRLILESPMTAYSKIFEQMFGKLSMFSPILQKWALRGFNKIHPELEKALNWEDIDMPNWGLPKVPILLLQSKNDTKLGRYHYDLIVAQNLDAQSHLIETLPHSRNRVNKERDDLIIQYIESEMK